MLLGRERELSFIEKEYAASESFVILYGRRGMGKTSIIIEFLKDKRFLYFSATKEISKLHKERFKHCLDRFIGRHTKTPAEWEDMFRAFAQTNSGKKKVLVLDDIQYISVKSSEFFEILFDCWERYLKPANVMVLLSGNFTSVTAYDGSGRATGNETLQVPDFVKTMKIRQMRFNQVHGCFPELTFTELLERFLVAGGEPKYFKYFYNKTPLMENISRYVLDRDAPLYDEPLAILEREVREPAHYFSILKVLSKTQQKLHDIYSTLGERANTLSPYISSMIDLNHVVKRLPPTEPNPEKSRRGNYYIYSIFISFWFNFIYPHLDELEIGRKEEAIMHINSALGSGDHMWNLSYRVARDIFLWLCETKQFDFDPGIREKTGALRDKDKISLPLVSMEEGTERAFCALCKYNHCDPLGLPMLQELVERCAVNKDVRDRDIIYGLFSKTGFDSALVAQAENMGNVLLVNELDIVVAPREG
ncbi:MAG: ATP-binding protein [Oscillospiraceae bacterium]|nr:ATP-binding protein [Oscillospiraceae bacterium]